MQTLNKRNSCFFYTKLLNLSIDPLIYKNSIDIHSFQINLPYKYCNFYFLPGFFFTNTFRQK